VHASDAWLPKRRAGSATTHTSKLPSRCAPPRFGFPKPRSSLHSPVSQKMERAPYMDPEAMKPVRPRGCPRDRSDLTARVAHTPKSIFSPSFPERNYRPQARVARTMKLLPSFRLPDAPASTSLHGAPVSELPLHPVSRTSKPPSHTGHPNSRATAPPGFPSGEAAPAARVAYVLKPTSTLRLPETSTLAPSHRLLELWNLRSPRGCPNDDLGPTALIRR
jgi:hypothetical protein